MPQTTSSALMSNSKEQYQEFPQLQEATKHIIAITLDSLTVEHLAHCPGIAINLDRFDSDEEKADVRRAFLRAFQGFKCLESINVDLDNFQEVLPISTICLAGATLEKLHATWLHRRGNDTVSLDDLKMLHEQCPLLEDVDIDLPMYPYHDVSGYPKRDGFEADEFVTLLSKFQNLNKIHLHAERSLGCADPVDSHLTDPDYEDAVKLSKRMISSKQGAPFETVTITLEGAYRPENWRKAPGGNPNSMEAKYHWWVRRQWQATVRDGITSFEVLQGSPFVGKAPEETEVERVQANQEWLAHLELHGDGMLKHIRPRFSPGMRVLVYLPEHSPRINGKIGQESATNQGTPGKGQYEQEASRHDETQAEKDENGDNGKRNSPVVE
ncbi:hypothetical protein WAI453_011605 [Rhynchosporium graminicola]|uniref:Uncharacterized protein n=1 Tax=Rhynchosporium graminicola TaxID=2792576 RepID=A0A1E1LP31_9HELO|nr:uncharacterized protein RCO7_10483 [Rhynchosporium commune]